MKKQYRAINQQDVALAEEMERDSRIRSGLDRQWAAFNDWHRQRYGWAPVADVPMKRHDLRRVAVAWFAWQAATEIATNEAPTA